MNPGYSSQKNYFSSQKKTRVDSIESPSPNKTFTSNIPIPDLSPLIEKENTFTLKPFGSYKKPKIVVPESPMKSPMQKYFTPVKIEGKNLFGTAPQKSCTFRKLTFDEVANPAKSFPKKKFNELLDGVDEKEEDNIQSPESNKNQANVLFKQKMDGQHSTLFDQIEGGISNEEGQIREGLFKFNANDMLKDNQHGGCFLNSNNLFNISSNNSNNFNNNMNLAMNRLNLGDNVFPRGDISGLSDFSSDYNNINHYSKNMLQNKRESDKKNNNMNDNHLPFIKNNNDNNKLGDNKPSKQLDFSSGYFGPIEGQEKKPIKKKDDYDKEYESLNKNTHKMDNEFSVIKTLSNNKFDSVYKVKRSKDNQIYAIKKTYKGSVKNNKLLTKKIFEDLNQKENLAKETSTFCMRYLDYWIEEENFDIIENATHFTDKNLFILYDYCNNGDLLDYLSKLEVYNYNFSEQFYWDIIFEMLIGVLHFHSCGYLHLDIKPANFLVNKEGYVILSDFGLSVKKSCLKEEDDIFEGDSTYISPEFFNKKTNKDLTTKCDVYSLGLSILEIMARVELPKNGALWRAMRNFELKEMPKEFLINWHIQNISKFLEMIIIMIEKTENRKEIMEIICDSRFPELNKRYNELVNNCYKKHDEIQEFLKSLEGNKKVYSGDKFHTLQNNEDDMNVD